MKFANRYLETLLGRGLTCLWEKYRALPGSDCSPQHFRTELDAVLQAELALTLQPQVRDFGILVSDLRGFMPLFEQYEPLVMVELLNYYYQVMLRVIDAHGGTVDKFMGDAIMAVFDSKDDPEAARHMLHCAIEMQLAMPEVNRFATSLGVGDIYMGIGLSYGTMVACDLGSSIYREVTVLGEIVNLASRIAAYCLRGQVLMNEDTYRLLQDDVVPGTFNSVHIKGKSKPVVLCEVLGLSCSPEKRLPVLDSRRSMRVDVDLPITYYPVEDKHIRLESVSGRIVDISRLGMRVVSSQPEDFLQEIKLMFAFMAGSSTNEIYAKVLSCKPQRDGTFLLNMEFTYLDEPTNEALRIFVDHLA